MCDSRSLGCGRDSPRRVLTPSHRNYKVDTCKQSRDMEVHASFFREILNAVVTQYTWRVRTLMLCRQIKRQELHESRWTLRWRSESIQPAVQDGDGEDIKVQYSSMNMLQ